MNIVKIPEYLSPSSFKEWEHCNTAFALKRMTGEYMEEPQSIAAAVGSAFDAIACYNIADRMGLGNDPEYDKKKNLDESLRSLPPEHRSHVESMAEHLFDVYESCGALKSLMDKGIGSIHPSIKKTTSVNGKEISWYAKPDLFLTDGTPVEFKVQGADSKTGKSPHPGYKIARFSNGTVKYNHDDCGKSLEQLNEEWALQMAIYSFMYTNPYPFRKINVQVENVAVRGTTIACATIESFITADYQETLYNRACIAWDNIRNAKIAQANVSKERCTKWGRVCPMSHKCDEYQAITTDPILNQMTFGLS